MNEEIILEALAVLAQQNREQDAEIVELKARVINAEARLDAQFKLLEMQRKPANTPSFHPVWRGEAA